MYNLFSIDYDLALGTNTEVFTVSAEPLTRIAQGGLLVEAGGVTIASGGLNMTGDLTILSGRWL